MLLNMFSAHKLKSWLVFLLLTFIQCVRSANQVRQPSELKSTVGSKVEIPCNHSILNYNYMYWYKQVPGAAPEAIIQGYDSAETAGRYQMSIDALQLSSSLTINQLEIGDSSIYYCAVRALGSTYTRALTFGEGTRLIVEPREQTPSTPSVFVLISDDVKNSTAACLAKNFYPDTLTMSMNSSFGESVESQKVQGALSKSGKYTAVRIHTFKQRGDVQCSASHEGKPIHSYGVATQSDPKPSSSPLPKSTCKPEPRSINTDVKNMEKVNMLSLTVLGLRVLFAKSLAFNVLLSVRLIAF